MPDLYCTLNVSERSSEKTVRQQISHPAIGPQALRQVDSHEKTNEMGSLRLNGVADWPDTAKGARRNSAHLGPG
ncbi:hypothetical protein JZ751_007520 [Albula glossodonta]|uniref:Uncharacterized protein n=1 Tax=Albula glossodonta TaxID=121402 RepID=A0A8T2MXM5_9TELE|nr:hypothetical protein JZ751_007520 [Albula glossodonta]